MATPIIIDFRMKSGDNKTFKCAVVDEDGVRVDPTGWSFLYMARESESDDADIIFDKRVSNGGITIDSTNRLINIIFLPSDTAAYSNRIFPHEIEAIDLSGNTFTMAEGRFLLEHDRAELPGSSTTIVESGSSTRISQRKVLRINLQDYVDKDGNLLKVGQQTFTDSEIDALIENAFLEVSEGNSQSENSDPKYSPLANLIARSDGLLMIATDEARRIKWTVNNKVFDETDVSKRLIDIARELRARYSAAKDRELKRIVEGVVNRNSGTMMTFNNTVTSHLNRDFNNRDVRRNKPRR